MSQQHLSHYTFEESQVFSRDVFKWGKIKAKIRLTGSKENTSFGFGLQSVSDSSQDTDDEIVY